MSMKHRQFKSFKTFDNKAFTIANPRAKKVPKMFPHAMIAVKVVF